MVTTINTGNETRITRRIIAEDSDWTLHTVPYLRSIALDTIITNWSNFPYLSELNEKEKQKVLSNLSLDLDLRKALLIEDNDYWKRRSELNWNVMNLDVYGGSYRRLFMERKLQETLENFIPNKSDYGTVDELLEIVKNDIERVKLEQLLPPVPQLKIQKEDDDEEDDEQNDHIDLSRVLPQLSYLTHLELSFGVKDVGMNFEWGFFTFSMNDAVMLSKCVHQCYALEVLAITRSRLEDEKARLIIKKLLTHPRLRVLNLSHNRLRDRTGRALGKMIKTVGTLIEVNVEDNEIGTEGATAIALGISSDNSRLEKLNISQNAIEDDGGIAICKSLLTNTTLAELAVGANGLGPLFAKSLSAALANNSTLKKLNIVSNNIGLEGGQSLSSGIEQNVTLKQLDLRLSGSGVEAENTIAHKLRSNAT